MASIIFQKNKSNRINQLILDATISENYQLNATVTSNPIEDGKTINDNIVNDPEKITIEGFITNDPIRILGGVLNESVNDENRSQTAFDALYELFNNKTLVNVVSHFKVYKDMAFENLTIPRNQTSGKAIRFTADLVKIVKVKSELVTIPRSQLAPAKKDSGQSSADKGSQTITPTTNNQAQAQSILCKMYGRFCDQ